MRGQQRTRIGTAVLALACALLTAGCVPLPPGSGGPPAASLQVTPSRAKFPSTPPPYWPMPIVHVTVTNSGHDTIHSIVVHPVSVYSVPSSTCTTLSAGQSCTANIQFCPSSPNHYVDTLLVTGQDATNGTAVQATTTLDGTAT